MQRCARNDNQQIWRRGYPEYVSPNRVHEIIHTLARRARTFVYTLYTAAVSAIAVLRRVHTSVSTCTYMYTHNYVAMCLCFVLFKFIYSFLFCFFFCFSITVQTHVTLWQFIHIYVYYKITCILMRFFTRVPRVYSHLGSGKMILNTNQSHLCSRRI